MESRFKLGFGVGLYGLYYYNFINENNEECSRLVSKEELDEALKDYYHKKEKDYAKE